MQQKAEPPMKGQIKQTHEITNGRINQVLKTSTLKNIGTN